MTAKADRKQKCRARRGVDGHGIRRAELAGSEVPEEALEHPDCLVVDAYPADDHVLGL